MAESLATPLTDRQEQLLGRVVEAYVATGSPVGSKTLVQGGGVRVSPSTVRNELAVLEELGLLTHPHTSAGRVPTEQGYRFYVDRLLERLTPRPSELPLDLSDARSQVEAALRTTTEALSEVTHLLALVSAPPLETTSVRHVEVLLLQPQLVMVVVITSTGGVTKQLVAFAEPVDPGLAEWAAEYLNDCVAGLQLGARLLRARFEDPELGPRERAFLAAIRPAFVELVESDEQALFVGGAAGLLDEFRSDDLRAYRRLLEVLEQRAALLHLMRANLLSKQPFVRVGAELEDPELQTVSLVGAPYGLRHRNLGTVSLLGPTRMDYVKAIDAVRGAARELSRFVEEMYED
ncbi:MAG TPA: heat-inducible transcriptional repressor HrcA [Gaiellaceae bacterium]|jgi:heat-inducible transcriptional repressor|nr:heat-inducible transcriptional repressor HrcA [Gaiellaceae bacterium]